MCPPYQLLLIQMPDTLLYVFPQTCSTWNNALTYVKNDISYAVTRFREWQERILCETLSCSHAILVSVLGISDLWHLADVVQGHYFSDNLHHLSIRLMREGRYHSVRPYSNFPCDGVCIFSFNLQLMCRYYLPHLKKALKACSWRLAHMRHICQAHS